MNNKEFLIKLKKNIAQERKIVNEIISLSEKLEGISKEGRGILVNQINYLKYSLKKTNDEIPRIVEKISLMRPLSINFPNFKKKEINSPQIENRISSEKNQSTINSYSIEDNEPLETGSSVNNFSSREENKTSKKGQPLIKLSSLEKKTLKRLRKREVEVSKKKLKKPSKYVNISNKLFSDMASSISSKKFFIDLKRDLYKTNLQFIPRSYISTMLFTTLLSIIAGILIFLFFLFFNFGAVPPFITRAAESLGGRFLKVFWIILAVPIGTFFAMYFYPSMERKSLEGKINNELPFASIHMFAISGSMVSPIKIFEIIMSTKEYPNVEREFTKLINEVNIYGYNLVGALRSTAFNSPSKKLSELFNGLATTINSGGDLKDFFDKRSQSLLFDYRLEREKYNKSAETFMDIYISVVIAAPMILMLLMIMIKVSGLGIGLSTSMITLLMIVGVGMINLVFLAFLHLKQPSA
ncbi:MAG: type II secretion system F family protein [archaeon]